MPRPSNAALQDPAPREATTQVDPHDRFFELATDLLAVIDYDGRLQRVNPAWGATLGYREDELLGAEVRSFVHPDELAATAERRAKLLAGDHDALIWETRMRCKDGSYRRIQFRATPFEAERIAFAVGRDITEQKAAEDALRTSQAQMARLAESGIIGISIADVMGNVYEANAAYADALGCTQAELVAGTVRWAEAIAPEYAPVIQAATREVTTQGFAHPFEVELVRRDGSRRAILCGVAMLEYPKCIAFTTDLTERKRAEESLKRSEHLLRHAQKMEAIGQLAAGIAHEMNTPAQYVTDNIVFLRRALDGAVAALATTADAVHGSNGEGLGQEQVAAIAEALAGAKVDFLLKQVPRALDQSLDGMRRVCTIVSAMKEFSHPSGSDPEPTDLRGLIEATLIVSTNEWKYCADVETDFDDSMPPVPCLRDELGQVVLNLVVNAAQAIRVAADGGADGKGTIKVSTRRDGPWAEIRVSDTGGGIPAEIRDRIFEPFFTTKPVGQGTGQGLAISYSIVVDKHGGQIAFDSTVGEGTCFLVRIPYEPRRARAAAPRATLPAAS